MSERITDEMLIKSLSRFAGFTSAILSDPQRWLGAEVVPSESPEVGRRQRFTGALSRRVTGTNSPRSPGWAELPVEERVKWWTGRVGLAAAGVAASTRLTGPVAGRFQVHDLLGASASGLAICATALEHGVTKEQQWVPLLAAVLCQRTLAVPPRQGIGVAEADTLLEQEPSLDEVEAGSDEPVKPANISSHFTSSTRTFRSLLHVALTLRQLQGLLDGRPRGSRLAKAGLNIPVGGALFSFVDERKAMARAVTATEKLLSEANR